MVIKNVEMCTVLITLTDLVIDTAQGKFLEKRLWNCETFFVMNVH